MKLRKSVIAASVLAALTFGGVATAQTSDPQATPAPPESGTAGAGAQSTTAQVPPAKKTTRRESNAEIKVKELKTIEVIGGIAGSQAQDLILKRYAPQTLDSITAVNIGQLPDVTISDALSRIPGVQIGRSGGEGTSVSIRGLPQIQTTLNGEEFLSAGGVTSTANFIDIPPTLFNGVDVIKSTTASDIAGGISGIVNFRTHRPFDFKPGWTFSGSATGDWGDRTRKLNKEASFLASYHNDRWGVLLTTSYSKETINNTEPANYDSTLGTISKITEQDAGFNFRGAGPLGNSVDPAQRPTDFFYQFDASSVGTQSTDRKRLGLDGSFQYHFSSSLSLVADAMYTNMKDQSLQNALVFQAPTPTALQSGPIAPVISPEGVLISGVQNYSELTSTATLQSAPTSALNTNLQLNYDAGGFFSGSLRWVHGHTQQKALAVTGDADVDQGNVIPLPDGTTDFDNPNGVPNNIPVGFNFTGRYPSYNVMQNISNPEQWVLISNFANGARDITNMNIYDADGELHFDSDTVTNFKFGVRRETQSLTSEAFKYLTPVNVGGACADPLGPGPVDALYQYLDPRIVNACSGFSPFLRRQITALPPDWVTTVKFSPANVTLAGGGSVPSINPKVLADPVQFLRDITGGVATGDPAAYSDPPNSWVVNETVNSAYGQLDFQGQLGSLPWSGNVGIRYVDTRLQVLSSLTNEGDFLGNGGSWDGVLIKQGTKVTDNDYKSWLPALNLALDTTDDQVLRFAVSKNQSRQNLAELGGGTALGYIVNGNPPRDPTLPQDAQIFVNGSSGNPELQPYRSTNYNLSYGWYFAPRSLVYVGAFFMDVQSFPEAAIELEAEPDADGVVRRSGPVSTFINGGGAAIRGVEAEFQTQFVQLPGWLSGFGVDLNYTHLKSTNPASIGANTSYNAVVFYQRHAVQVRLAWNWQGRTFLEQDTSAGNTLNLTTAPVGYLDASFEYQINKNISFLLQGTNLTDAFDKNYLQFPSQWATYDISERRLYAGLRVQF